VRTIAEEDNVEGCEAGVVLEFVGRVDGEEEKDCFEDDAG
jgi:hypothetical protein